MGFLHTPKKKVQRKLFYFPVQAALSPFYFGEIQRCFMPKKEHTRNSPSKEVFLSRKSKGQCLGLLKFRQRLCVLYTDLQILPQGKKNKLIQCHKHCIWNNHLKELMAPLLKSVGAFATAGTNQTAVAQFGEEKVYWFANIFHNLLPCIMSVHHTLQDGSSPSTQNENYSRGPSPLSSSVAERSKQAFPAAIPCSTGICFGNAPAKASETSCCGRLRFQKPEKWRTFVKNRREEQAKLDAFLGKGWLRADPLDPRKKIVSFSKSETWEKNLMFLRLYSWASIKSEMHHPKLPLTLLHLISNILEDHLTSKYNTIQYNKIFNANLLGAALRTEKHANNGCTFHCPWLFDSPCTNTMHKAWLNCQHSLKE